jgi:hypothetical protein
MTLLSGRETCTLCGQRLEPGKVLPPDYLGSDPPIVAPVYPTHATELICPFCGTKNK